MGQCTMKFRKEVKYSLPKLQDMLSFGMRGFNPHHNNKAVKRYDRRL
jgi:hypothetical protein